MAIQYRQTTTGRWRIVCLLKLLRDDSLRRETSHRNVKYAGQFSWERATDWEENALLRVFARRRKSPG